MKINSCLIVNSFNLVALLNLLADEFEVYTRPVSPCACLLLELFTSLAVYHKTACKAEHLQLTSEKSID